MFAYAVLGFLSPWRYNTKVLYLHVFTNHRIAGEGREYFFDSSLPLPPLSYGINVVQTKEC